MVAMVLAEAGLLGDRKLTYAHPDSFKTPSTGNLRRYTMTLVESPMDRESTQRVDGVWVWGKRGEKGAGDRDWTRRGPS